MGGWGPSEGAVGGPGAYESGHMWNFCEATALVPPVLPIGRAK